MTVTDIGILLIVLCIVLWAILAALHRHTVQLEALKKQMQQLLKAQEPGSDKAAEPPQSAGQHGKVETLDLRASSGTPTQPARRKLP